MSLALQACGSDQNRPVVVATVPAQGASLAVTLYEVRFTFDDPVTILNASQIAVDSGGVGIPLVSRVDPDDERSILVAPAPGSFWRAGDNRINLRAGFEINDQGHYRLDDYRLAFTLGVDVPVFLAVPSPASVVEVDGITFGPLSSVPTPGGRVDLNIPAGARSGQKLRLKGRGIPGPGGPPGDQFVVLQIVVPPADTQASKDLYRQMAREIPFNPRTHLGG